MKNKYVYTTLSSIKGIEEDEYYEWEEFVNIVNKSIDLDTEVSVYPFNEYIYKVHLHYLDGASKGTVFFILIDETSNKKADMLLVDFNI